jgi:hypothetical protein
MATTFFFLTMLDLDEAMDGTFAPWGIRRELVALLVLFDESFISSF